jgi:hypothetical protein
MAAIAAGQLLYPFRTQKISLPAFHTVLKCASLRELWIAAIFTLIYSLFSNKFCFEELRLILFSKTVSLFYRFFVFIISLFSNSVSLFLLCFLSLILYFISVRLSEAKRTACCCTCSATPSKSSIYCDPEAQFGCVRHRELWIAAILTLIHSPLLILF